MDANYIDDIPFFQKEYDVVVAEYITFDKKGIEGVGRGRIPAVANSLLKDGGYFIIRSGHIEPHPDIDPVKTLPNVEGYPDLLTRHGFEVTVLKFKSGRTENGVVSQNVWYVCKKKGEGFSKSRYKPEIESIKI